MPEISRCFVLVLRPWLSTALTSQGPTESRHLILQLFLRGYMRFLTSESWASIRWQRWQVASHSGSLPTRIHTGVYYTSLHTLVWLHCGAFEEYTAQSGICTFFRPIKIYITVLRHILSGSIMSLTWRWVLGCVCTVTEWWTNGWLCIHCLFCAWCSDGTPNRCDTVSTSFLIVTPEKVATLTAHQFVSWMISRRRSLLAERRR